MPKKLNPASMDIADQRRAELKAMFPGVFTETRNEKGQLVESIDFEKLKEEFATKGKRKRCAVQDVADLVEQKLQAMLECNPLRMDYYKKYQEIIADYNREKDRVTIEETFNRLLELYESLDEEEKRFAAEGLASDEELALYDLLKRDDLSKVDRERLKRGSQQLLAKLMDLLRPLQQWTQKEQTQAEVEVFILDKLFEIIPMPPYSAEDTQKAAERIYQYIWQRSEAGTFPTPTAA